MAQPSRNRMPSPPTYYVYKRSPAFFIVDIFLIIGVICLGIFFLIFKIPVFFVYDIRMTLVLFGLFLVTAIGMLIADIIRFFSWKLTATPLTLVLEIGLFSKKTTEIHYSHINAIHIKQTILGRLFHEGDIIVTTGNDISLDTFIGIEEPHHLQDIIYMYRAALDLSQRR
jgi:uncharacterized membrane protein YdbT with pleckstrin-like domain